MEIRSKKEGGKNWFAVVDIIRYSKEDNNLHKSARSWLLRNLSKDSYRKINFKTTTTRKGGKLLCVDSAAIQIVGMYEAHLRSGKDFRAKWADLPDTPSFSADVKKQLSWKNLYVWSVAEHTKNSGIDRKQVAYMRAIGLDMLSSTGDSNFNENFTLEEALVRLGRK